MFLNESCRWWRLGAHSQRHDTSRRCIGSAFTSPQTAPVAVRRRKSSPHTNLDGAMQQHDERAHRSSVCLHPKKRFLCERFTPDLSLKLQFVHELETVLDQWFCLSLEKHLFSVSAATCCGDTVRRHLDPAPPPPKKRQQKKQQYTWQKTSFLYSWTWSTVYILNLNNKTWLIDDLFSRSHFSAYVLDKGSHKKFEVHVSADIRHSAWPHNTTRNERKVRTNAKIAIANVAPQRANYAATWPPLTAQSTRTPFVSGTCEDEKSIFTFLRALNMSVSLFCEWLGHLWTIQGWNLHFSSWKHTYIGLLQLVQKFWGVQNCRQLWAMGLIQEWSRHVLVVTTHINETKKSFDFYTNWTDDRMKWPPLGFPPGPGHSRTSRAVCKVWCSTDSYRSWNRPVCLQDCPNPFGGPVYPQIHYILTQRTWLSLGLICPVLVLGHRDDGNVSIRTLVLHHDRKRCPATPDSHP